MPKGRWQLALERAAKLPKRRRPGVDRAGAAHEDDTGGEGAYILFQVASVLRTHWPCSMNGEACVNYRAQERLPPSAGYASVSFAFGLLESVIDRHRKGRMYML